MTIETKIETLLEQTDYPSKLQSLYYVEQQINNGLYKNTEKSNVERSIYIDSISKIDNIAKNSGIILPEQERLQKAFRYITTCSDDDFWSKGFPSFTSFRKSLWQELLSQEIQWASPEHGKILKELLLI